MKASKQQKRKLVDDPPDNNDRICAAVKKSGARAGGRHKKAGGDFKNASNQKDQGALPSGTPQLCGNQFPNTGACLLEKAQAPTSKLQAEQPYSSMKIKLQLFPINKVTRLGLKNDGYNPFLELTLNVQKKISSVIKHLNAKWGSSSIAVGQLVLFPYNVELENLASCRRWTMSDNNISAAEVCAVAARPPVFRLRYGWVHSFQLETNPGPPIAIGRDVDFESESMRGGHNASPKTKKCKAASEELVEHCNVSESPDATVGKQITSEAAKYCAVDEVRNKKGSEQPIFLWDDCYSNLSIGGLLSEISLQRKIDNHISKPEDKTTFQPIHLIPEISVGGLLSEVSLQEKIKKANVKSESHRGLQPAQSTSAISIGGLLSEGPLQDRINNSGLKLEKESGFQPVQLTSESRGGCLLSKASSEGKINVCNLAPSGSKLLSHQTVENNENKLKFPWDDSLTSLSIGGLLSEASLQGKITSNNRKSSDSKSSWQLTDSLESFIAAQLNSDSQMSVSHSSILDVEETCHPFSSQQLMFSGKEAPSTCKQAISGGCCNETSSEPFKPPRTTKNLKGF